MTKDELIKENEKLKHLCKEMYYLLGVIGFNHNRDYIAGSGIYEWMSSLGLLEGIDGR